MSARSRSVFIFIMLALICKGLLISKVWAGEITNEDEAEIDAGGITVETGDGVAVLTMHEVDWGRNESPFIVAPPALERMIVTAREAGYVFLSLGQFHDYMDGKAGAPDGAVLLTFDDGYRGVYENGHPILFRQECPAVMFPVTKWYSRHPRPEWARPHLSAPDSVAMLESGIWGFGGHTHDGHRTLPVSSPATGRQDFFTTSRMWMGEGRLETGGEYRARLWADVELMSLELRRLGVEPRDFAAPYGKMDGVLDELLGEAGYDYVYVGGTERNYPGQRAVYRVDAGDSVESFMEALDILWGKKAGELRPSA